MANSREVYSRNQEGVFPQPLYPGYIFYTSRREEKIELSDILLAMIWM
jgi:hypothetical protein